MTGTLKQFALMLIAAVMIATVVTLNNSQRADAFVQGRLIEDHLFIDSDSMTASEIQAWLNTEAGFLSSWLDTVNIPFPGKFDVNGNKCWAHKATGKSAAQIIREAANDWQAEYVVWRKPNGDAIPTSQWSTYSGQIASCRNETTQWPDTNLKTVSPKVLLTTLQKEQGLISATGSYSQVENQYQNPCNTGEVNNQYGGNASLCYNTDNEYKLAWAMGYGVPDSGGKNHRFIGFYSQMNWAAWQFRYNFERSAATPATIDWDGVGSIYYSGPMIEGTYIRSAADTPTYYSGFNTIDGQSIYFQNRATASLYHYTPHTYPGFFGNYNFVQFYSQWFGPVLGNDPNVTVTTGLDLSPNPFQNQSSTATFTITNDNNYDIFLNSVKVAVRDQDDNKFNFPAENDVVVSANDTYTYSQSRSFDESGNYDAWIITNNGATWSTSYPIADNGGVNKSLNFNVTPNPTISTSLSLSDPTPDAGDDVTATFTVTNYDTSSVNIGDVKVAVRDNQNRKFNFPTDTNVTVPASGTYTYSETRSFPRAIRYDAWVLAFHDNKWKDNYPALDSNSVSNSMSFVVQKNPLVTTSLAINPSPHVNEQVTATFTLSNPANNPITVGDIKVAGRDKNGNKVNFPTDASFTVPAGGTATYSESRSFPSKGEHTFWITNFADGKWNDNYPASDGVAQKTLTLNVHGNPTLTVSLALSNPNPNSGQNTTATFTVTNHSGSPVNLGDFKVAVRDSDGAKFNFANDPSVTVNGNDTYTYSETRSFPTAGSYNAFITRWNGSKWDPIFPLSETGSILREINFNVN